MLITVPKRSPYVMAFDVIIISPVFCAWPGSVIALLCTAGTGYEARAVGHSAAVQASAGLAAGFVLSSASGLSSLRGWSFSYALLLCAARGRTVGPEKVSEHGWEGTVYWPWTRQWLQPRDAVLSNTGSMDAEMVTAPSSKPPGRHAKRRASHSRLSGGPGTNRSSPKWRLPGDHVGHHSSSAESSQAARLAHHTAANHLLVVPACHSPRSPSNRGRTSACCVRQGGQRAHGVCQVHVLAWQANSDELWLRSQGTRRTAEVLPVEGQVADECRTGQRQSHACGKNHGQRLPFVVRRGEESVLQYVIQFWQRSRALPVYLLEDFTSSSEAGYPGEGVQSEARRWARPRQGRGLRRCRLREIGVLHSQSAIRVGAWQAMAAFCTALLPRASR